MSFFKTITDAVRDIEEHGFDSQSRIDTWVARIKNAALLAMAPEHVLSQYLNNTLRKIYERLVTNGGILKLHKISRFTLETIKPKLRAELDRRRMTNAQLIKINREEMILRTEQRFRGWASSIPAGGTDSVDTVDVKQNISKPLKNLPFTERRVMIDQAHKFSAELNKIVAVEGGAIAAEWNSHWRQPGYDYRPDHKERDKKVYALRGNWALEKGLMKRGANPYYDEITAAGQEVYCRCSIRYIYSISGLPDDMITEKGRYALQGVSA